MSKRTTTRASSSSSKAGTTSTSVKPDDAGQGDAAAASAGADDVRSRWPLSAIATAEQVAAAGIRNGMSMDEIEAALARVMGS